MGRRKNDGPTDLFIVFLFLGSRKFLLHRIHTACDSIFESIRYAFDDECITRNADLDFGSFAFLDILKGNLCLLRHAIEKLGKTRHLLLDETNELLVCVELKSFDFNLHFYLRF